MHTAGQRLTETISRQIFFSNPNPTIWSAVRHFMIALLNKLSFIYKTPLTKDRLQHNEHHQRVSPAEFVRYPSAAQAAEGRSHQETHLGHAHQLESVTHQVPLGHHILAALELIRVASIVGQFGGNLRQCRIVEQRTRLRQVLPGIHVYWNSGHTVGRLAPEVLRRSLMKDLLVIVILVDWWRRSAALSQSCYKNRMKRITNHSSRTEVSAQCAGCLNTALSCAVFWNSVRIYGNFIAGQTHFLYRQANTKQTLRSNWTLGKLAQSTYTYTTLPLIAINMCPIANPFNHSSAHIIQVLMRLRFTWLAWLNDHIFSYERVGYDLEDTEVPRDAISAIKNLFYSTNWPLCDLWIRRVIIKIIDYSWGYGWTLDTCMCFLVYKM